MFVTGGMVFSYLDINIYEDVLVVMIFTAIFSVFEMFFRIFQDKRKGRVKTLSQAEKMGGNFPHLSVFDHFNLGVLCVNNDGIILKTNSEFCNKTGYDKEDLIGKNEKELFGQIAAEVQERIDSRIDGEPELYESNLIHKDGEVGRYYIAGMPLLDSFNQTQGSIGVILDVTDFYENQQQLEKIRSKLEESLAKEKTRRSELIISENKIKKSLEEKNILLREIHHRVKNNLQIITSLLSLQSSFLNDEKILDVFKTSQQRINSMAIVHEMLYQTEDLTSINYKDYLKELFDSNFKSFFDKNHKLKFDLDVSAEFVNIETAITLGLLINEILTNSFKYGFAKKSKEDLIYIKIISLNPPDFILQIGDNGIGMPRDYNFKTSKSLGVKLVHKLVRQLSGNVKMDYSKKGTHYIISFKEVMFSS